MKILDLILRPVAYAAIFMAILNYLYYESSKEYIDNLKFENFHTQATEGVVFISALEEYPYNALLIKNSNPFPVKLKIKSKGIFGIICTYERTILSGERYDLRADHLDRMISIKFSNDQNELICFTKKDFGFE